MSSVEASRATRVLAIGPALVPVHGQSTAFHAYVDGSRHALTVIDYPSRWNVLGHVRFLLGLLSAALRPRFDCVYLTTTRSLQGILRDGLVVCLFSWRMPVVNHLHGADFLGFRARLPALFRRLVDAVYERFAASVVLSEGMREQYRAYPAMSIHCVWNCAEETLVRDLERISADATSGTREVLRILFLSNLMEEKGVLELIDAVESLSAAGTAVELRLAGAISSERVRRRVEEAQRMRMIRYVGVVRGAEKAELLAWSDVLALPSYYSAEAQPICLMEGMLAGSALLTSRVGYVGDVWDTSMGEIVDTVNRESVAAALEVLASDRERLAKTGMNNRSTALRCFRQHRYAAELDTLLDRVVRMESPSAREFT